MHQRLGHVQRLYLRPRPHPVLDAFNIVHQPLAVPHRARFIDARCYQHALYRGVASEVELQFRLMPLPIPNVRFGRRHARPRYLDPCWFKPITHILRLSPPDPERTAL